MNVMNRKLFANRAARRRLANMGGIMTSSPELMQAAQTYQVGGSVGSPTSSVLKTVELNGVRYKVYTDGRVAPDFGPNIPTQPMDPNNASQAFLIEELKALPDVSSQLLPPPVEEDISFGQKVGDSLRSFFQPIGDKGKEIGQPIGDKLKEVGAPIGPAMREGYASAYSNPNLLSGIVTEVPEMLSNMVSSSQSTLPDATEIQPVVKADGPGTLSGDNFIVAPDEGYSFPTDAPEVKKTKLKQTEESAAAARETSLDQPNPIEKIADKAEQIVPIATNPDVSPEQRTKNTSTTVLSGLGVENVDNMSTKQRVKAYQDMFKEFLGEDDKDVAEEKWHNLAMIGFAIAAGESPSALANIANGLLEGSKVMKTDRDARRKREDSITSMAIEQVFSEKAAEKDAQLRRDIAAAKGGSGFRDPRNPIDAFLNAKSDAKKLLDDVTYRSMLEKQGVTDFDQWASDQAMRTVQETYPSSTLIGTPFEIKETPTQTTPTATDLPTISTQEEYDALPPGSEFIQNGQKRRKP